MNKLQDKLLQAYIWSGAKLKNFIRLDDGDTNFLSIAIILVIVIGMAAAIMAFRTQIMNAVSSAVSGLVTSLSSYGSSGV